KQTDVKSQLIEMHSSIPLKCTGCSNVLIRHGGLMREGEDTTRVRNGCYRCPHCNSDLFTCSPKPEPVVLPSWHRSVACYLSEVGTHGIPDMDRPQQCPCCLQSERKTHRHSKFERSVFTVNEHFRICIFRFRCP